MLTAQTQIVMIRRSSSFLIGPHLPCPMSVVQAVREPVHHVLGVMQPHLCKQPVLATLAGIFFGFL